MGIIFMSSNKIGQFVAQKERGKQKTWELTCPQEFFNDAKIVGAAWNQTRVRKDARNFEAPV